MKHTAILLATVVALASAEVPQEKSHGNNLLAAVQTSLQLNNPLGILDPVFGLLGDAAAADGAGQVTNLKCLQQNTADQAFTNAKTLGDLDGQVNALLYRAIERNTGSVGLASELCDETAVNAEIAALTQHQDPASENAQQLNKDIVLSLAVQLASIGADPTLALLSGTFLPGDVNDPTGAGNTCDDDEAIGCIFTQNLIVADATIDEINAAVADVMGASAPQADASAAEDLAALAVSMMSGNVAAASVDAAAADVEVSAADEQPTGTLNVQNFQGNIGAPPVAINSNAAGDKPFEVNGATFGTPGAAIQRACDVQKNACANAANSGQLDGGVQQCDAQQAQCLQANQGLLKRAEGMIVKVRQVGALDLGSCSNPGIQFAEGLDGRKEASFGPLNTADFNHGSANNVAIITDFICQRLGSSCDAPAETVAACEQGSAAAKGASGAAAAQAFNDALGV